MKFTPVTEKHCFSCGTTKPVAAFSKNNARKDGLQTQCKACESSTRRLRRLENPAAEKARVDAYYAANKTAINAKHKTYQSASPDVASARSAKHYQNNRSAVLARSALRYQNNRAEILVQSATRFRDNRAVWYAKTQRYVARKLQAIPGWADKDAITSLYTKAKELSPIFGIELNVDHVVPLRSKLVCGLHTHANLQLLEKIDNIRKGNRTWPDMPGES